MLGISVIGLFLVVLGAEMYIMFRREKKEVERRKEEAEIRKEQEHHCDCGHCHCHKED